MTEHPIDPAQHAAEPSDEEKQSWERYGSTIAGGLASNRLDWLEDSRSKLEAWTKGLMAFLTLLGVSGTVAIPTIKDDLREQVFWISVALYLMACFTGLMATFAGLKATQEPREPTSLDGGSLAIWFRGTKATFDERAEEARNWTKAFLTVLLAAPILIGLASTHGTFWDWEWKPWDADHPQLGIYTFGATPVAHCGTLSTDPGTGAVRFNPQGADDATTPVPVAKHGDFTKVEDCP